jgi:ferredoxin-NADP reductase
VAIHDVQLTRRENVAEGTMAFYFTRPSRFQFRAGQSLTMSLVNPPDMDGKGATRPFTIASAPHEPALMIATRLRDSTFKRFLRAAPAGTPVRIDGPNGEMVLHDDPARPAVLLAGGIGITPFLSMARHASRERLPHRIHLFYSNRRPEDAAFLAELRDMEQLNPNYHLIATMAEADKSAQPWSGETGFIRSELLERHLPDTASPVYYFAGPPAMAMAMQEMLQGIDIGEDAMRYEEFYGY